MQTGWFLDRDGKWYYLNPKSDGTMGRVVTGWHFISGSWYYFNQVSDGTYGALLVNTVTPDGYRVDVDGKWVD